MSSTKAIIDLGTNTFQLLIANWETNGLQIEILENRTFAVSLGLGAMDSQMIQEEAKNRAWKALDFFSTIIQNYQLCDKVTAIGTSIIRNAHNGDEFLKEIQERYEFKTLKISGQEEAELIFMGVVESMPKPWTETSLIMDIGGGSTEFILFSGREIHFKGSYEIGGLKMLSLFHQNNMFHVDLKSEMELYMLSQIQDLLIAIQTFQPNHLIGAAGAFETLNDLEIANYSHRKSSSQFAEKLSVEIFYEHKRFLEQLDLKEREDYPGMKPFRAGILPIAMLEIDLLLKNMQNPSLWFSNFSLKEGYFLKSFSKS